MLQITQQFALNVTPDVVWKLLTDPRYVNAWGGGPATIDDKVNGEFELWGGDIWGKNIEVKKNHLLKQEWYAGEWPAPSIVTFQLVWDKAMKKTVIDLLHTDFPESEGQSLATGWDKSFFGQIHAYIEANKQKESHAKTATV